MDTSSDSKWSRRFSTSMRIPFKSKKSYKGDSKSDSNGLAVPQSTDTTPRSSSDHLGEFGRPAVNANPQPKRSFFKRSQTSTVTGANEHSKKQSPSQCDRPPATISAGGNVGNGHPLRQQTLPAYLEPSKGKRPLLSYPKRSSSMAPFAASPYSASSSSSVPLAVASTSAAPQSQGPEPTSSASDSFQLRSFRAVSGVRDAEQQRKPTLSSLAQEEAPNTYTASPFSTRPNSPSPSLGATSYFDSHFMAPSSLDGHERTQTGSGSISVAKFREARAARSTSSLGSFGASGNAPNLQGGLKLDLPPPLPTDFYSKSRTSVDIVSERQDPPPEQPPKRVQTTTTSSNSAGNLSVLASDTSLEAYSPGVASTVGDYIDLYTPHDQYPLHHSRGYSASEGHRSPRLSSPVLETLAAHPDNALPLPPIPSEPFRPSGHSRRQSVQSVSSLSSALGGWISATSANLGLPMSLDDVQKAVDKGTSAIKSATPALDVPFGKPKRSSTSSDEKDGSQEEVLNKTGVSLSKAELVALLGGKVLPPPPSETGDDDLLYGARSRPAPPSLAQSASRPNIILSRASSVATSPMMAHAKNLFSSSFTRPAKPAKDDEDDADPESETESLAQDQPVKMKPRAVLYSSSESDESDGDSDDSEVQARKNERARVFPPPRPRTPHEREQAYKTAQTPPNLTPAASFSDLHSLNAAYARPPLPLPALTAGALKSLEPDDDEDVPLSTIARQRGTMSELGLRPSAATKSQQNLRPPLATTHHSGAASTLGITPSAKPRVSSNLAASMSSALSSSTSSTSSAMQQRSLSTLTSTASQNAINPLSHQRSSSTQGIPTLSSNQTTSTTLSELIAAEMARDGLTTSATTQGHKHSISGPSTSSDSSLPRTPSELSAIQPPSSPGYASSLLQSAIPTTYRKHKSSQSEFGFGNFSAKNVGSLNSSASNISSTASLPRHAKTNSVPLAKLNDGNKETVFDKMRNRHRMEAQQNGLGFESHPPVSLSPLGQAYPPVLGPQSIQGLPCPPGVDPVLYASLPPDQKLALQHRAQQMMSMMQSFALQAQSHTMSGMAPSPSMSFAPPMHMMSPGLPAFPSMPSFYGAAPAPLPFNPRVTHSSSFSTLGYPQSYQQQQDQHSFQQRK